MRADNAHWDIGDVLWAVQINIDPLNQHKSLTLLDCCCRGGGRERRNRFQWSRQWVLCRLLSARAPAIYDIDWILPQATASSRSFLISSGKDTPTAGPRYSSRSQVYTVPHTLASSFAYFCTQERVYQGVGGTQADRFARARQRRRGRLRANEIFLKCTSPWHSPSLLLWLRIWISFYEHFWRSGRTVKVS